jgi:hypothetical protein
MKKNFIVLLVIIIALDGIAQKNPCNPSGASYSQLPGDTTITLPSGTMLTFNRCEFFDVKDCMEITEMEDPAQLQRERINMYDDKGNVLMSYGMLKIKMDSCSKRSFELPVKFRIRLSNHLSCGQSVAGPKLFIYRGGIWDNETGVDSKITTIDGKNYIEFTTKFPAAGWNCDVILTGRWVTFKAPKGKKITYLSIATGCPLFYMEKFPDNPKHKLKIRLACTDPSGVIVQSILNGKDTTLKKVSTLDKITNGGNGIKCSRINPKFLKRLFDWEKKKRGKIYRRYFL